MNPRRLISPFAVLAVVWTAFAAYVLLSAARMPEVVATHFGPNGTPNDWQPQASYVRFTLIFGAVVPAFILGIFSLIRFGDGSLLNIPHKDYWLAPERRQETFAYVQRQSSWLAGLMVAFFASVHYFIVAANAHAPVQLSPAFVLWVGGGFLALTIGWVGTFIGHFFRRPL